MKKKEIVVSVAVCALLSCFVLGGCSPRASAVKISDLGDGKNLRVGIIGDFQLPASPDVSGYSYERTLYRALNYYKNRGIDALMVTGDICNYGTEYAYDSFNRVYNDVFGDEKPVNLFIMGNHDYWYEKSNPAPATMQKRFQQKTGESPWSHKVLNGYHFICFSPVTSAADSYSKKLKWAEEQIDAAIADSPEKPVFVVTHHNVEGTVYGSDEWGSDVLKPLFDKYPQLVSFSGHSHFSLTDERSIWQDTFTAVQTQSLSYIELEKGKENGSVPPDSEANPMGIYMTLSGGVAVMERIAFAEEYGFSGQVQGDNWVVDFGKPAAERFKYTAARADAAGAPVFTAGSAAVSQGRDDGGAFITFGAARPQGASKFVHSYMLVFYDKDDNPVNVPVKNGDKWDYKREFYYFSDFYKGVNKMSDTVKLYLPALAAGEYRVRIFAVESFGKSSADEGSYSAKTGSLII